jgi:hypothetical protein
MNRATYKLSLTLSIFAFLLLTISAMHAPPAIAIQNKAACKLWPHHSGVSDYQPTRWKGLTYKLTCNNIGGDSDWRIRIENHYSQKAWITVCYPDDKTGCGLFELGPEKGDFQILTYAKEPCKGAITVWIGKVQLGENQSGNCLGPDITDPVK